ncbi:MAG: extracellular solute-binding protein [Nitrososphaeria archaeon]
MSKKILILVLAVGIVMSVAIGGIAFADQATPVTLTVTLNNYYYPTQYPEFAKMTEKIVQQYEALHPNVHITLIPWIWSNQTDYETWLTAQYAAGKEPDIAWEQYYNRWIEPGWWVSLDKYLEEPDPYAAAGAGKEHWKDAIPEFVWNTTVAPDGKQYSLCLDWAETGLYYNEEIFNKLGISPNFTSWDQFMQDLKIIKEHGYIPLDFGMSSSQWSTYQWVDDIFTTAVFASEVPQMEMPKYNEQYNQYYKGEEWRDLTPEEIAKAIYDGLYSAYSPQFVEFLKLVKEFSQYWPNGFASLSYNDMLSLFASGKAAMMWYGNSNRTI